MNEALKKFMRSTKKLISVDFFIFIVAITLAATSVTEITSREKAYSLLMSRKEELYKVATGGNKEEDTKAVSEQIKFIEHLLTRIQTLRISGSLTDQHTLNKTLSNVIIEHEDMDGLFAENKIESIAGSYAYETVQSFVEVMFAPKRIVERLPDDMLYSLSMILCGLIGVMITGFRSEVNTKGAHILLGLATGFIVFLTIKGGKVIFVVESVNSNTLTNPYTGAFIGVLAGLFTERAYGILSLLVDKFISKIENSIKVNDQSQG